MKYIPMAQLLRLCKTLDNNTPFRKRNFKHFLINNNIQINKVGQVYLINKDDFFEKINPKNIEKQYSIPKVRTMQGTVDEYNNTHADKITIHLIEELRANKSIQFYKGTRLCLINYDEVKSGLEIAQYKKRFHRKRY